MTRKPKPEPAAKRRRSDSAKIHVRFPDLMTKQKIRERADKAKTSVSRYLLTAALITDPMLVGYELAEQDKLERARKAVA